MDSSGAITLVSIYWNATEINAQRPADNTTLQAAAGKPSGFRPTVPLTQNPADFAARTRSADDIVRSCGRFRDTVEPPLEAQPS